MRAEPRGVRFPRAVDFMLRAVELPALELTAFCSMRTASGFDIFARSDAAAATSVDDDAWKGDADRVGDAMVSSTVRTRKCGFDVSGERSQTRGARSEVIILSAASRQRMARLVVACLLVASSSEALLPVQGATLWPRFRPSTHRPRAALLASAGDAEDPEVTQWARSEAAKSIVDAMYKKAAAAIGPSLKAKAVIAGYSAYALGFFVLLVKTLMAYPLVPPSPNSLAWCRSWLFTTVVDYYGAALALVGIIMSSEPKLLVGLAWSAGCLFLGTPFCCLYVAVRLFRRGSLAALKLADS